MHLVHAAGYVELSNMITYRRIYTDRTNAVEVLEQAEQDEKSIWECKHKKEWLTKESFQISVNLSKICRLYVRVNRRW